MNKELVIRIVTDVLMTISLLLLMPYSLLSETAHEWIGMAMLILFIFHHVLNRRWIKSVVKGKYKPLRIIQTLLVVVMLLLMLGSMASGILLSTHIFKDINIAGTSMAARQVHMFCAYWGFAVMSVHIGMHWNMAVTMAGKLFKEPPVLRGEYQKVQNIFREPDKFLRIIISIFILIALVVAGYGIFAFHKRQIGEYLLMKMHFVFYDYTENVMFFMLDYLAVMILIAVAGYYISMLLKKIK